MSSSAVCVSVVILVFSSRPGRLWTIHVFSVCLLSSWVLVVCISLGCVCASSVVLSFFAAVIFHLFMIIFAASSRLWCKFVSISCRLCLLFFSGLQPVFHSFVWSFVVVVWFVTLIEVSFVADFSPRDLFDSLVIFCCFCICFVGSWCCYFSLEHSLSAASLKSWQMK